jgi:hypothetical protein
MLNENTHTPPLVMTIAAGPVHVVAPKDGAVRSSSAKPGGAVDPATRRPSSCGAPRRWRRAVGLCVTRRRRGSSRLPPQFMWRPSKMAPCGWVVRNPAAPPEHDAVRSG